MKKLLLLAPLAILLAGCGSIPQGADRINMITAEEAEANGCKLLDKAGSVSAILINGYKRNTQVAVRKALKVPGATHVGYTKGKPGASNVRMFMKPATLVAGGIALRLSCGHDNSIVQ